MMYRRLTLTTLLSVAVFANSPAQKPEPDSGMSGRLVAFSSRGAEQAKVNCEDLASKGACSRFEADTLTSFGISACYCKTKDGADWEKQVTSYAAKHRLIRLSVSGADLESVISTREIKLLSNGEEQRASLLSKLAPLALTLSPVDGGSPYRVMVRRKDGAMPTAGDLKNLHDRLNVEVEVEKLFVSAKNVIH
jgi:hypothetical protein